MFRSYFNIDDWEDLERVILNPPHAFEQDKFVHIQIGVDGDGYDTIRRSCFIAYRILMSHRYELPAGMDLKVADSTELLQNALYPWKSPLKSKDAETKERTRSCGHLVERKSEAELFVARMIKTGRLWDRLVDRRDRENMKASHFFQIVRVYSQFKFVLIRREILRKNEELQVGVNLWEVLIHLIMASEEIIERCQSLKGSIQISKNTTGDQEEIYNAKKAIR
jgi:hypothetical protein